MFRKNDLLRLKVPQESEWLREPTSLGWRGARLPGKRVWMRRKEDDVSAGADAPSVERRPLLDLFGTSAARDLRTPAKGGPTIGQVAREFFSLRWHKACSQGEGTAVKADSYTSGG